jgi:hypothetical protein
MFVLARRNLSRYDVLILRSTNPIGQAEGWQSQTACNRRGFRRYKAREVGGGRATRQPGQVRKEAALTSSGSGRSSTS